MGVADTMLPAELELSFAETHFAGAELLPSQRAEIDDSNPYMTLRVDPALILRGIGVEREDDAGALQDVQARVQDRVATVLNSAATQLLPLHPTAIVRGLNGKIDLHPDILAIANEIEGIIFESILSGYFKGFEGLSNEEKETEVVRLGEWIGELYKFETKDDFVTRNIDRVRLQLKLLGHVVAERMLDLPRVMSALYTPSAAVESQVQEQAPAQAEVVATSSRATKPENARYLVSRSA